MGTTSRKTHAQSTDLPPLGVKIYAGFVTVVAALILLFALVVHPLAFVITLPFVGIDLLAVYGLWNMKTWGWYLSVVLKGLAFLMQLADGNPGFVLTAMILAYLIWIRDLYL